MALDPRREAQEWLDVAYEARVLEPSPPGSTEPPWYADDPVLPAAPRARPAVTPVDGLGALSWDQLCGERGDEALAAFCADRWLGAWHRLGPLPTVSRRPGRACTALPSTCSLPPGTPRTGRSGCGSPGADSARRSSVRAASCGSNGKARRDRPARTDAARGHHDRRCRASRRDHAGRTPSLHSGDAWGPGCPAGGGRGGAEALGAWFGFAWSVLEQLRHDYQLAAESRPRVQLWPEHFDASIEIGDEAAGERATFGASPGDATHPEPYLYVSPWAERAGAFWNDDSFDGASLPYATLLGPDDQRATALAFFGAAIAELTGPGGQSDVRTYTK